MPQLRKATKTCSQCGLEAIDALKSWKGHIPADETRLPCSCCIRNPKKQRTNWRADFHSEQWCLDSDGSVIFEDPTPHEVELLKTLRLITTEQAQKMSQSFHGSF